MTITTKLIQDFFEFLQDFSKFLYVDKDIVTAIADYYDFTIDDLKENRVESTIVVDGLEDFISYSFPELSKNKNLPFTMKIVDFCDLSSHTSFKNGVDTWIVIEVTDNKSKEKSNWRIPGWTSSYEGNNWNFNDITKVQPAQVLTTVWMPTT